MKIGEKWVQKLGKFDKNGFGKLLFIWGNMGMDNCDFMREVYLGLVFLCGIGLVF